MLQLSGQYLLLGANLGLGMQVLQAATAAGTEMGARGRYPVRTRRKYLNQLAAVEVSAAVEVTQPDGFTRQRVFDERNLAVDVRDAAAVIVERLDMRLGDGIEPRAARHGWRGCGFGGAVGCRGGTVKEALLASLARLATRLVFFC